MNRTLTKTRWEKLADEPVTKLYATFREKFPNALIVFEDLHDSVVEYVLRGDDAVACSTYLKQPLKFGYSKVNGKSEPFISIPAVRLKEVLEKLRRHTTRFIVCLHSGNYVKGSDTIELKDFMEVWGYGTEYKLERTF